MLEIKSKELDLSYIVQLLGVQLVQLLDVLLDNFPRYNNQKDSTQKNQETICENSWLVTQDFMNSMGGRKVLLESYGYPLNFII